MASYAEMKAKQLQDLLRQRGLPFRKLKKDAMIQALIDNDQHCDDNVDDNVDIADDVDDVDNDDEDVQLNIHSDSRDEQSSVGESEQLTALRLQLEIAKLELQKAQLSHPNDLAAASQGTMVKLDLSGIKSRLPSMSPNCDVMSFFATFERTLQINDVPKEFWAKLLPAALNERAMKLYAQLDVQQCNDYSFVRSVVIDAFKTSAESYFNRMQSASRTGSESYKLFLSRLREYQSFYFQCKQIDSFEKLKEDMILNLFMASLPQNVNEFVKGRTPTTANDAASAADLCFAIKSSGAARNKADNRSCRESKLSANDHEQASDKRTGSDNSAGIRDNASKKPSIPLCFLCKQEGHKKNECPMRNQNPTKFKNPICFICGGSHQTQDHANHVPAHSNSAKGQIKKVAGFVPTHQAEFAKRGFIFSVQLNGRECTALRDTGCNHILFNSSLINDSFQPLNREVCLTALFGQRVTLPLFNVSLQSKHFGSDEVVYIPAAAVNDLPFDVVVGNCIFDLPAVRDLICKPLHLNENDVSVKLPVSNLRNDQADLVPSLKVSFASTHNYAPSVSGVDRNEPVVAPVADDLTAGVIRPTSSNKPLNANVDSREHVTEVDDAHDGCRTQPARERRDDSDSSCEFHRLSGIDVNDVTASDLFDHREQLKPAKLSDFAAAQRSDTSLNYWKALAEQGTSEFLIENELLFKITDHWSGERTKLLVVPKEYRTQVLELAHDSPFGGHLGRRKTVDRIIGQGRMIWPKLNRDVQKWIAKCHSCQMVSPIRKDNRLPLTPIPHISTPFEDVSFDTLGSSLKATPRGNQYLLIHVDNASRYVDIVPMKNLKTETTVNALMSIWTRVGFPKKARFDQSSANMSKLMTALMERLGIEGCPSAVYLHHTSGLAERHIKTVSAMVRKFLPTCPRNWDNLVPILQMAVNDTVCETTGLTPTEILTGRRLRGPLTILREIWVNGELELPQSSKNVLSYLNELRQTLQTAADIAQKTADSQQTKMKFYYDKHATDRRFVEGQKALLLMPSSSYKMEATWTGPVTVIRAVDDYNYEVQLENRKQTFHANMLKPFNDDSAPIGIVISADDESTDDELPTTIEIDDNFAEDRDFNIGKQLTDIQRKRLKALLADFSNVFTERTGRTRLVEHNIVLKSNAPCAQPPYKIPDAVKDEVENEIAKLLAGGFLQESQSSYSAPLLIVKKRGNKIRLVNNFKRLNDVTADDGYLMADPADLLSKAAGAKFVSTIDLKNFFWQISLAPDCRKFTSFRTPWGSFEWCVMAQGLKGAPLTAQRLMDKLLRGASKYASSMQDDIICYSLDFESHLIHLRDILMRLSNAGLTANTAKCNFVCERIQILGHTLQNGDISPSDDKVEVVKNLRPPNTKRKLAAFLGLTNYYRNHIKSFSDIAFPLTELLKKKVPDNIQPLWNESHERAFDTLRKALISKPVLRAPDPTRQYVLQADSSAVAVGATLSQYDDSGNEYVIGYVSQKLSPRQRNYSVIELECLAIVTAVRKFEQYIYARKVELYTDHAPLQFLHNMAHSNSRLARWSLFLQKFDLQPKYRSAALNKNVDGLSRII
jgi:hypothetical protein